MKNLKLAVITIIALLTFSCKKNASEFEIAKSSKDNLIKFNVDGSDVFVIQKGDKYYLNDCIILSPEQLALLRSGKIGRSDTTIDANTQKRSVITNEFTKLWPNGVIPYTIGNFSNTSRITEAIAIYNQQTPIRLVPRANQSSYVTFVSNPDSSDSWIGRTGNNQIIRIADWATYGTVMHEIGHAVGLGHEHQRPDRNSYIWVEPTLARQLNYQVLPSAIFSTVGTMDYGSIMMYPGDGQSMKKLSDQLGWPAQRTNFSNNDLEGIYYKYQPYSIVSQTNEIENYSTDVSDNVKRETTLNVNFFRDYANSIPMNLPFNCRLKVTTFHSEYGYGPGNVNNYQTVEYVSCNKQNGWSTTYESATNTYLGYAQPGHHEISVGISLYNP